jgi:putative transposase
MVLSLLYRLVRGLLDVLMLACRGDRSKDAELLVLRHENAVLRQQVARVRYNGADRVWLACWRGWSRVAAGPRSSPHSGDRAGLAPSTGGAQMELRRSASTGPKPTTAPTKTLIVRLARETFQSR